MLSQDTIKSAGLQVKTKESLLKTDTSIKVASRVCQCEPMLFVAWKDLNDCRTRLLYVVFLS